MERTCLLTMLVLGGCGYTPVVQDNVLGKSQIQVMPFAEDTPVGLSADLTHAVAMRLASQGITLCVKPTGCEAIFSGRVVGAQTVRSPIGGTMTTAPAYDLRVQLEGWLVDADGKELWRSAVEATESFLPATGNADGQLAATEANRRRALRRLAETAAQLLCERLALASATSTWGA